MPLVVTTPTGMHEPDMAAAMRLAAHGFMTGTVDEDHPTSPQYGPDPITVLGLLVEMDPSDPLILALPLRVQAAMLKHHLLVDLWHDAFTITMLPVESRDCGFTMKMILREDRADLPADPVDRRDLARIADHAADLMEAARTPDDPEAIAGMAHLRECARIVAAHAQSELGKSPDVQTMSQDQGSDLVVLTNLDDEPDVHVRPRFRLALAAGFRPQFQIVLFVSTHVEVETKKVGSVMWNGVLKGAVSRREASHDGDDAIGTLELLRCVSGWPDEPHPRVAMGEDPSEEAWPEDPWPLPEGEDPCR